MKCEGTITPLRYEGTHYVKVDKVLCPGCDKIAELRTALEALTKRLEALEPTPGHRETLGVNAMTVPRPGEVPGQIDRFGDVTIYDGRKAGMDTTAGWWQTVCEKHHTVCSHKRRALAKWGALFPAEWCEECAKERVAKEAP